MSSAFDPHVESQNIAALAMDDLAVPVENSLRMMNAMRAANHPVEAHLLQAGGHAFGTGRPRTPSASWPDLFHAWLLQLGGGQQA